MAVHRRQNNNWPTRLYLRHFSRLGVLMVTCAFSEESLRWKPVLFSWMFEPTIKAFRAHFLHLFRCIHSIISPESSNEIADQYYGNVMEFSAFEREGFIQAFILHIEQTADYADLMRDLVKAHRDLPISGIFVMLDQKQRTKQPWGDRARRCLRSCSYHFEESIARLKENEIIVPHDAADCFQILVDRLRFGNRLEYDNAMADSRDDLGVLRHGSICGPCRELLA